jgi:hypothetical protein
MEQSKPGAVRALVAADVDGGLILPSGPIGPRYHGQVTLGV